MHTDFALITIKFRHEADLDKAKKVEEFYLLLANFVEDFANEEGLELPTMALDLETGWLNE